MPGTPDMLAALRAGNAELRADLAGVAVDNAELKKKLARLERLLSRNSANSPMSPGSDDQTGKTPPDPRKRRGAGSRKPGEQRGAAGASLGWNEDPDEKVLLFPEGLRVRR